MAVAAGRIRRRGARTRVCRADGTLRRAASPLSHRETHQRCVSRTSTARALCEHAPEVELALWFHDAIYEPRAKDNEEKSADWAVRIMRASGVSLDAQSRVHALIMTTCHDALPATVDEQVLVDIDLSILGADAARSLGQPGNA